MLARVLLAVVLCGIAGGFLMGVMQHVRLTPIILAAEKFEVSEAGHSHAEGTPANHHHHEDAWAPADGWERTVFTFAASILTGVGFAAMLAGVAFMLGGTITKKNGWIWGLCGFLAVSLAPAAGLAPELPGMPTGELTLRQIWWVGTIAATAAALWLLAFTRQNWAIAAALALALMPHFIGAPLPASHESGVPAALAAHFAGSSLGANAIMWLMIGVLLGRFLPEPDAEQTQ